MKKILSVFILTLVMALSANAEEQKIYNYEQIECTGDYENFCKDENGNPITGMAESMHDGNRVIAIEYKNGMREGKSIVYSPDGIHPTLEFSRDKNGELNGENKVYWADTHTIKSEVTWKNGKRVGKSVNYYKDGKKQFTVLELDPIEGVDVTPMEFDFFDRNEQLFARFDLNGITCYDKDNKARNATTIGKMLKMEAFFDEQEKTSNDPIFYLKEHDFTFLCK